MPTLTIGKVEIPYVIRWSEKAKRRRIVVTPEQVEVVAPIEDEEAALLAFVEAKRRWIFDKRSTMDGVLAKTEGSRPSRFATGAKIPYRGRMMRLTVQRTRGHAVSVDYRNGFIVGRPKGASDTDVRDAIVSWLKARLRSDAEACARTYAKALGEGASAIRVKDLVESWGSCGRGGTIHLNWKLVFAPKAVLAYAVAHEMAHLRYREHSSAFWATVGELLPDYAQSRAWLDRHQDLLERSGV